MACNAIAMATARVALNENLAEYIDTKTARLLLETQLDSLFGSCVEYPMPQGAQFKTDDFLVTWNGQSIKVTSSGWGTDSDDCQNLADDLINLFAQAAGLIMQDQIAQAVGQMGWVSSDISASNGARVLTIEV